MEMPSCNAESDKSRASQDIVPLAHAQVFPLFDPKPKFYPLVGPLVRCRKHGSDFAERTTAGELR